MHQTVDTTTGEIVGTGAGIPLEPIRGAAWMLGGTSEEIGQIAAALAKAQGEFGHAAADHVADVRPAGKAAYQYRYTTLADVLDACRTALASHGIAVVQRPRVEGPVVAVQTVLLHESGEWISDDGFHVTARELTAQGIGGALTYARRYGLCALLGIAQADDDAQGSTSNRRQQQQAAPPVDDPAVTSTDPLVRIYRWGSAEVKGKPFAHVPTEALVFIAEKSRAKSVTEQDREVARAVIEIREREGEGETPPSTPLPEAATNPTAEDLDEAAAALDEQAAAAAARDEDPPAGNASGDGSASPSATDETSTSGSEPEASTPPASSPAASPEAADAAPLSRITRAQLETILVNVGKAADHATAAALVDGYVASGQGTEAWAIDQIAKAREKHGERADRAPAPAATLEADAARETVPA